jgi:hypothetical protein
MRSNSTPIFSVKIRWREKTPLHPANIRVAGPLPIGARSSSGPTCSASSACSPHRQVPPDAPSRCHLPSVLAMELATAQQATALLWSETRAPLVHRRCRAQHGSCHSPRHLSESSRSGVGDDSGDLHESGSSGAPARRARAPKGHWRAHVWSYTWYWIKQNPYPIGF